MSPAVSRRRFLGTSLTTSLVGMGYFSSGVRSEESKSPNERLNIAAVGVANKGGHNVEQLEGQNIVAICDVDENFLNRAAVRYPQARRYRDYRKMLEQEGKRAEAVVVSTADHTHAPAAAAALALGKHVYCEKPLAHTVTEARVLARLAAENKVATQMGTQIHASENYRRVVEVVQSGILGDIKEVYSWCNKGWSDGRFRPSPTPAPTSLDWDLWLGPAKQRPYCLDIHPGNWRRFWEYGSGTFGDMACHVMDLPFWALGLRHPTSVVCEGPEVHPDGAPAWVKATYEFPRKGGGSLPFHWSDGGQHFDVVKQAKDSRGTPLSDWGLGVLFIGEKGQLAADYGRRELLPSDQFRDVAPPPKSIPDSIGHWNEWVQACKTGSPTTCNFDYSGALTETVLLGIVAFRAGEKIQWDGEQLRATNSTKAAEFLTKEYRAGFEVAGLKT